MSPSEQRNPPKINRDDMDIIVDMDILKIPENDLEDLKGRLGLHGKELSELNMAAKYRIMSTWKTRQLNVFLRYQKQVQQNQHSGIALEEVPGTGLSANTRNVGTSSTSSAASEASGMGSLPKGLSPQEFVQSRVLGSIDLSLLDLDGDVTFERAYGHWFDTQGNIPVDPDDFSVLNKDDPLGTLTRKALVTAQLHSLERQPQPRCHPGTRENLMKRVHDWLADEDREKNILWLSGPAGVGKSAMAQSIGDFAESLGILGAAIFFSSSRKVDDSSRFITSVASQLAERDNTYRKYIIDLLQETPGFPILSDKQTQLKKLLIEPFYSLRDSQKRLILIDGLDECQGDDKQLELVRLIVEAVTAPDPPPFSWIICSRPEHHLKDFFRNDIVSQACSQIELLPQESGAEADIERYLIDGLERITEQYPGVALSAVKDSEELRKLTHAACGVFIVASSILGFVGDPVIANPPAQLQVILDSISDSSTNTDGGNFLAPIDALYVGVLNRLGKDQRQKTLQLLGACAVSPPIPALHLANLAGFAQKEFYSALQPLHAFLSVPHYTTASQETLHFFHVSFPDFLGHRPRSKDYFQDFDMHRSRLIKGFFHVLNSTSFTFSQELSWPPSHAPQGGDNVARLDSPLSVAHDMSGFAATHTWELCMRISKPRDHKTLFKTVAGFDFRRLRLLSDVIPVQSFVEFVRWLYALGREIPELKHIVHTNVLSKENQRLLKKCGLFLRPLDLESTVEVNELEKFPRYIFVGFAIKTVIALLVPEAVIIYSVDDISDI